MESSLLQLHHLKKRFGQGKNAICVLQDITASFEQGCTYAIMGVSGTGKSTLMHILAGLDVPTNGTVTINGQSLSAMSERQHEQFLQQSVGLVFQSPYLIKELSVKENIMLPGLIASKSFQYCNDKALMLLQSIGLEKKANAKPASLSGGQQQRISLVRALINEPAFLIADEPTGNLDEQTGRDMMRLILRLQKEWCMGIIVSTHDQYVADCMQMRYRLHDGRLQAT